jgi:hypothetical protein
MNSKRLPIALLTLAVFSATGARHESRAGTCTDAYIDCVLDCRATHGYTGTWRDLGNVALQLCYQECNIELLNCLAGKAGNLKDFIPKLTLNGSDTFYGFEPGEEVLLSLGLWENPSPADDWSVDDFYGTAGQYLSLAGNDWEDLRFEFSADPVNEGWTTISGTATLVDGMFFQQSWTAPDSTGSFYVRAVFGSVALTGSTSDPSLDGDLGAYMQMQAIPEPSTVMMAGLGGVLLIGALSRRASRTRRGPPTG